MKNQWTAISIAYGEWKNEGTFSTKREAAYMISCIFDCEEKAKKFGGVWEIDGRHLVVKTADLEHLGYTK